MSDSSAFPASHVTRAVTNLEKAQEKLDFYGRVDLVADTLLDAIERVKAGEMKPAQGNSIALLCSTLIKALEAARGNTPAVSITAQLNREEIEEILHGRDPFRSPPTIMVHPVGGRGETVDAGNSASRDDDTLPQSRG